MSKKIDINEKDLKSRLSDREYQVLRCEATEAPFSSELLEEKRDGAFACKVCGQPIFSSNWKYESGTGWPSFYDAIPGSVEFTTDHKIGYARTEFHCSKCGSHFGHVFEDGPNPTGKRFCTNGIALKFEPK